MDKGSRSLTPLNPLRQAVSNIVSHEAILFSPARASEGERCGWGCIIVVCCRLQPACFDHVVAAWQRRWFVGPIAPIRRCIRWWLAVVSHLFEVVVVFLFPRTTIFGPDMCRTDSRVWRSFEPIDGRSGHRKSFKIHCCAGLGSPASYDEGSKQRQLHSTSSR